MKVLHLSLLVVAVLGCGAAVAQAQFSRKITPVPPRRGYLCIDGRDAEVLTRKANEAGAQGWKMVSGASNGHQAIFCFEQFLAARPTPE